MILVGLLLGIVGTDVNSGIARYSFGISELSDGIGFVSVAMGMFGFGEIIANLEQGEAARGQHIEGRQPDAVLDRLKMSFGPIVRGTALGTIFGILPGSNRLSRRSRLTRSRRNWRKIRRGSVKARSKALPVPRQRTTPPRKPHSFRC